MSPDLRQHFRAVAEALPMGTAVPIPRELLLELLDAPRGLQTTSASPTGTAAADEQLLKVEEVATRFGLSEDWLYRHWKAVGGVKLGRKVLRFPASALPRYLAAKRKGS